jgi:hypothetical protein
MSTLHDFTLQTAPFCVGAGEGPAVWSLRGIFETDTQHGAQPNPQPKPSPDGEAHAAVSFDRSDGVDMAGVSGQQVA